MDRKERLFVGLIVSVLIVFYAVRTHAEETQFQPESGMVERVVDGDTFIVLLGKKEVRVRMLGIDAPEMKSNECYAAEATRALQMAIGGKKVVLQRDERNKDEYGRLLRYVSIQGNDVNYILLQQGFARVLVAFPFEQRKKYVRAEEDAKSVQKGLWGRCS